MTTLEILQGIKSWIVNNVMVLKETPATTTQTLAPNKFYDFGEVASLSLTFGTPVAGRFNEYMFQFTSGNTATTLTLPAGVKWYNDEPLEPDTNMVYQVSVVENLAVYTGWEVTS